MVNRRWLMLDDGWLMIDDGRLVMCDGCWMVDAVWCMVNG